MRFSWYSCGYTVIFVASFDTEVVVSLRRYFFWYECLQRRRVKTGNVNSSVLSHLIFVCLCVFGGGILVVAILFIDNV